MKAGIPIWMVAMILLLAILLSSITSATNYQTNTGILQFPAGSGSWNARVPCSSPWIVRITDITDNKTGSASQSSSIFSPGITSPVGIAKRWLTPGSTPPGWVSPGPPCTITNSHGTVVVFVEIDGVQRESIANEDCSSTYDTVNGAASPPGKLLSDYQLHFQPILPHYSPDHHVHGLSFRRRFPLHIQLGLRRRRLGNWKPNDPCLFNKRSLYGYPDRKRFHG